MNGRARKPYRQASFPPPGVPFRYDGSSRCCPWCHTYITTRSTAVRLPRPTPIDAIQLGPFGDQAWVSRNTRKAFKADGSRPRATSSWYAHERCWRKYGPDYGYQVRAA